MLKTKTREKIIYTTHKQTLFHASVYAQMKVYTLSSKQI